MCAALFYIHKLVTRRLVITAGPLEGEVANMLGVELPVYNQLHGKVVFNDHLGMLQREAQLLIWIDPQRLPWTKEERLFLAEVEDTRADYDAIVLRGLAVMIPGMQAYFNRAPRPHVDGGYTTKTLENRPLIGPLAVEGIYLIGALSGFGVMASAAAGELLTAYVTGCELPG